MKKMIMMAAIVLLGYNAVAQETKPLEKRFAERKEAKGLRFEHKSARFENLTPEQRAELKVKKMALQLDLTDKQQRKLIDLNAKKIKEFKDQNDSRNKLSRYEFEKKHLDAKIEYQREFKKILNKEQNQKWESLKAERKLHNKNRFENSGFEKQQMERSRFEKKNFKHAPRTKFDSIKKF